MDTLFRVNLTRHPGRAWGDRQSFIWEKNKRFEAREWTHGGILREDSPPAELAVSISDLIDKIHKLKAFGGLDIYEETQVIPCDCGGIRETTCPECEGTGKLTLEYEAKYCPVTYEDINVCPFCDGTGVITQKNINHWNLDVGNIPNLNKKPFDKSCPKCLGLGSYEKDFLVVSYLEVDAENEYVIEKDLFKDVPDENIFLSSNRHIFYEGSDKMILSAGTSRRIKSCKLNSKTKE